MSDTIKIDPLKAIALPECPEDTIYMLAPDECRWMPANEPILQFLGIETVQIDPNLVSFRMNAAVGLPVSEPMIAGRIVKLTD